MKRYSFRRVGDEIELDNVSLSGRITVLAQAGTREVWRVAPGKVYAGQGRPWLRTPSRLMIVNIVDGLAHVERECQPGADWRRKRQDFIDEARELGGSREAMAAFKREG
jgi:hypothetical protein